MEAVKIETTHRVGFFPDNYNVFAKKQQHDDLDDFLKGTITGDELVNYVCDKLDEKYCRNVCLLSGF